MSIYSGDNFTAPFITNVTLDSMLLPIKENEINHYLLKIKVEKENILLQARQELNQDDYAYFEDLLSGLTYSFAEKLNGLKGLPLEMIIDTGKKGFFEIQSASDQILKELKNYRKERDAVVCIENAIDVKIDRFPTASPDFKMNSTSGSYSDFIKAIPQAPQQASEKLSAKQLMAEDPLWAYKKTKIEGNMALAGLLAGAFNGFNMVAEKALLLAGRGVCAVQLEPVTRNACHQILDDLSRPPEINENEKEKSPSPLVNLLESNFLIPPEQTRQYEKDSTTCVINIALLPIGFGIGKVVPMVVKAKPLASKAGSFAATKTVKTLLLEEIGTHAPSSSSKMSSAVRETIKKNNKNFHKGLKLEHAFLQNQLGRIPPANLPTRFPPTLNQFLSNHEKLPFKIKGIARGDLMYKQMDDKVLFMFSKWNRFVKKSPGICSEQRMKHLLETTFHFARENNHTRLFIAFDPMSNSIASILSAEQLELIVGKGVMSKGHLDRPLTVLEFAVR